MKFYRWYEMHSTYSTYNRFSCNVYVKGASR